MSGDIPISRRPVEFGETEAFTVRVASPRFQDPFGNRRFRVKKAKDVEDAAVEADDLEALRWLREKRGSFEDGRAYSIQRYSETLHLPYTDDVPAEPVTVEFPVFYPGTTSSVVGRGDTLRQAVANAQASLSTLKDARTYPEFNEGLDRVLLKVGAAEFRVADLCALIRDYYDDDHGTGGALHTSLDDGNMAGDVRWEVDFWRDEKGVDDRAARLIGELLMLMTEDERKKLYERGYGR